MLRAIVQLLKVLTIGVTALLVATGGARVFALAIDRATPDDVGEPVEITIAKDEDADKVADKLAAAGLIRSKLLFTGQMRINSLQPEEGTYTLTKGMTVEQIMDRVSGAEQPEVAQAEDAAAEVGAGTSVEVTIPEGLRLEEIAELAEEAGVEGGAEAFMQAIRDVDRSQYSFLADLPAEATLEGYLFPDTYNFIVDNPAYNVDQMLTNFETKVMPEASERAAEMGIDVRTVLTFASLVEKEAQVPDERPVIADVYISRFMEEWRLEADPTVQYAIGKRGDDWWPQLSGEDLFFESPYNTYQRDGLPPGPICNPGLASIQAVLVPAVTDYMYFVAKGDSGEHAFAVTKAEQDANDALYNGD